MLWHSVKQELSDLTVHCPSLCHWAAVVPAVSHRTVGYSCIAGHWACRRHCHAHQLPGSETNARCPHTLLCGCLQGKALHGEQYLEIKAPLPPAATVVTTAQVLDVQDKGKGAVVVLRTTTTDTLSGKELAVNEFTTFVLQVSSNSSAHGGPNVGCTCLACRTNLSPRQAQ